jgi:hypothetical protein
MVLHDALEMKKTSGNSVLVSAIHFSSPSSSPFNLLASG